jgi:hypothetical protein
MYYDGSIIRGRVNGSGDQSGVATALDTGVMQRVDIGSGFNGDIAEIILFPFRLEDSGISGVERYLKYKWGSGLNLALDPY